MARNRAKQEHTDRAAREQYLESYQRLIANWIEAIVDQQSKATLAEFNSSNQRKATQKFPTKAVAAEG
jgi:hypothetical protein